jgi:predicted dehydrogenase
MKNSPAAKNIGRRQFLKAASAALVLPAILPASVLGRDGKTPPSGRINVGIVGWGMQGPENTQAFLAEDDCRVIAACDLDKDHLADAVQTINSAYSNKDCAAYHDYRELMARPDLDAVMLAVPDHWHALVATEAARRKLDIYGEKPLAKTVAEQQAIVQAVEANNIIWQTGSWQRSQSMFRKAAEIVRNGLIGEVTHVEVGLMGGFFDHANVAPELLDRLASLPEHYDELSQVRPGTDAWKIAVTAPPPQLDYEMWIGPSAMVPYIKQRSHMAWRWNYNTGGGMLMDWVGHHLDIAHWGLDFDNSGPSEIEGKGEFPPADALWNTCTKFRIEMKYPRGINVLVAGGYDDIMEGTKWIGPDGWVWVNREGFDASNPDWFKGKSLPDNLRKVKLYESPGHERNFLDCVKSRRPTITPVQTAHHSTKSAGM